MSDAYIIRIIELASGQPTPEAGRYIREFDPQQYPPRGTLVSTPDRTQARRFQNAAEAHEYWMQDHGTRPDGKPNRPLTAFTVTVEPL